MVYKQVHQDQKASGIDRQIGQIHNPAPVPEDQEICHLVIEYPVDGITDGPAYQETAGGFEQRSADFALAPVIEDGCYKNHGNNRKILAKP